MIRRQAIIGMIILLIFAPVKAEEISLSEGEIENLGIRFANPSPAVDGGGIEATARVTLPPAGDRMISVSQTGLITSLRVDTGDEVVQGQVLAEFRSSEFISLQREFLEALNAQRLARSQYERDQQLHDEGIVSLRRFQETTAKKAVSDAALGEHLQLLKLAGMLDSDLRMLERDQKLQVSLKVRAPFDGIIVARLATTGARIDPMEPIYRLVNMEELWLEINVPQERLGLIRSGSNVNVNASGSTENGKAVVMSIGRTIDPSTQSTIVRARLEQGAEGFRPGQFVVVRILNENPDSADSGILEIPARSVISSGNASYIFVRTNGGVEIAQVELVSVAGSSAFVRGDIEANDLIATSGVSTLKSVWISEAEEES